MSDLPKQMVIALGNVSCAIGAIVLVHSYCNPRDDLGLTVGIRSSGGADSADVSSQRAANVTSHYQTLVAG